MRYNRILVFKCHLFADTSQTYIFRQHVSPEPQTHKYISSILFDIFSRQLISPTEHAPSLTSLHRCVFPLVFPSSVNSTFIPVDCWSGKTLESSLIPGFHTHLDPIPEQNVLFLLWTSIQNLNTSHHSHCCYLSLSHHPVTPGLLQ